MVETAKRPRQSVANLNTASDLSERRQEISRLRNWHDREWALNRSFYRNEQWVIWNRVTNQVEQLPTMDGDKPRWRVRMTANQVTPGVNHMVAQLTKTRPMIAATPDSGSDVDIKAAEMATALYEWWWKEMDLNSKVQGALINANLSQGYWKITWDALAGKTMEFMIDPQSKQPITDEELASAYKDNLKAQAEQMGLDPAQVVAQFTKTVSVGDIRVEVMPGENVYVDPTATDFSDAKYIFCRHSLDPDEIYARWGKVLEPNSKPSSTEVLPMAYANKKDQRDDISRDVFIGYFKPQSVLPKGRIVVWTEEPNIILADEPWPYPFTDLPFVHFPGIERPGSALDEPHTSLARPYQKELNRTISQIVQHKDMAIKPQMIAPVGSLRDRLTDEPGAVFQYMPVQGQIPQWRDIPALPQYAFNILADIQQRIDRAYNRMPSQRDQLPARADSGNIVESIHEVIADQITPVTRRIESALAQSGKLMALLAQQNYIEPRLIKIYGQGGSVRARKFMNTDLKGGFSFHAQMDTGLPRTREGKISAIKELLQLQVITPKQALVHLDMADVAGVQQKIVADEDMAHREHDEIIKGNAINPWAAQAIMPALQQGVNPETGQQLQSPQEAQELIKQAALGPTDFEDWETHLDVHGSYLKSVEFRGLPEEAQSNLLLHYNLTYKRIIDMRTASMGLDPATMPKLNVSTRATVSAPVMQEVLRRHGIEISEEEIVEPPLETNVTQIEQIREQPMPGESDYMSAQTEALSQKHAEEQHQMAMAQQAFDLQAKANKHEQDLRHAQEKHDVAKKQASKPKSN